MPFITNGTAGKQGSTFTTGSPNCIVNYAILQFFTNAVECGQRFLMLYSSNVILYYTSYLLDKIRTIFIEYYWIRFESYLLNKIYFIHSLNIITLYSSNVMLYHSIILIEYYSLFYRVIYFRRLV